MLLRIIILGLLTVLTLNSCLNTKPSAMGVEQAAVWMLGDTAKNRVRWILVQIYDPYQGGRITKLDTSDTRVLDLYRNGTFEIVEHEKSSIGRWYVKSDKSELAFVFYVKEGKEIPKPKRDITFTHQIRKFSQDSMILAWKGRHGFVEELYVADKLKKKFVLPAVDNSATLPQ